MEYTRCRISALALAKMSKQAVSGGQIEVMGLVVGHVEGSETAREFVVNDAFALPVEATETRVNAMGEAYAYIVQYMDSSRRSGRADNVVGWYHSHPGYGCFLSQIDIDTQAQNQQFQDPFVAIVLDPLKTMAQGRTEIAAFRTDSPTTFRRLEVVYFANAWDAPLLTTLDARTFAKTLSRA